VAGKKLVEVDAVGEYLRTLTVVPPQNGATIQLAIDLDLQKTAYEAIKGKKAAVAAKKEISKPAKYSYSLPHRPLTRRRLRTGAGKWKTIWRIRITLCSTA
jgi:hypothetical protein